MMAVVALSPNIASVPISVPADSASLPTRAKDVSNTPGLSDMPDTSNSPDSDASDDVQPRLAEINARFYTQEVWRLMKGRKAGPHKQSLQGWLQFEFRLREIFAKALHDNPYAIGILVLLECQIRAHKIKINRLNILAKNALKPVSGRMKPYADYAKGKPITITAYHPYGYLVSDCMVEFDRALRLLKTAANMALIPMAEADEQFKALRQYTRRILAVPSYFDKRIRDLTFDDVIKRTEVA
ncbi:MAG: TIGR03761 family integrating conjugative element protein, partial [Gammaproteobacteria bacterium]|nr:TIGR03761 family integrating conjugative element protein [Gammaproteobacteria bacterium]